MSLTCPYCQKSLNEGTKYCTGCGRQIDDQTSTEKQTALTDLKECFGAFPSSKIECYLCADELKCSSFTNALYMNDIRMRIESIENKIQVLSENVDTLNADMRGIISNSTEEIVSGLNQIKLVVAVRGG